MDTTINEILAWAWARHHNILSWYIRPLFLIPFCYFAWKRSITGMVVTLILLATSMAWFPAPATPDPQVIAFLQVEKDYLTGAWTPEKILMTLIIPLSFTLLAAAFWRRSWAYGLGVVIFMAVSKIIWSVGFGGEYGWSILPPALIGLGVCTAAIIFGARWLAKREKANKPGEDVPVAG